MASGFEVIAGLIFAGGGLVFHSVRAHRRLRTFSDTPRSKAESAPQGFVELEGFAWPANETFRNGEDQEAVYYSLLLQREETQGSGKNRRKTWKTIYTYVHNEMFYLVDPTGLVALDLNNAEINLESARTRHWKSLNEKEQMKVAAIIPKDVPGFPPTKGFFGLFSSKYRIVENEILVGCPLFAQGDFRGFEGESYSVKLQGLTGFSEKVFDKMSRQPKNRNGLLDSNRDGKVSAEELRRGSVITAGIARKKAGGDFSVEVDYQVHGNLGSIPERKLFLADTSEEHISLRLRRWLWPKFGAGAAMVALGVVLMVNPSLKFMTKRQNVRQPAHQAPSTAVLKHEMCVRGDLAACQFLVDYQHQFRIPPANVVYYQRKLSGKK
ncbi:hypothetical protein AZI86_04500 [Bdellovibrio bacteriovorus]|uniref:RING-type E3 ubiquitin transferase n=1 Tax=Bdellovibrio bacteriovorus TaxID=959 RepID=A0A150WP93_BDEBC|nr:hypothetical protein [Bdellovibrio bacteriovorus]KYG66321.1 hypothetical protein AZI86_04500 [Bdellovibrio bacteriovorus]